MLAIDGLAGTGKSTLARMLAKRLVLNYLDTGATFRMTAWAALKANANLDDEAEVVRATEGAAISFENGTCIVDGVDVSSKVRSDDVSAAASKIAVHPQIRQKLLKWQRSWVDKHGDSVVEGRDTTSVVFPDASLKVFLEADAGVRAARRSEAAADSTAARDQRDTGRATAPLVKVPDALVIDTTRLSLQEVETLVVKAWKRQKSRQREIG